MRMFLGGMCGVLLLLGLYNGAAAQPAGDSEPSLAEQEALGLTVVDTIPLGAMDQEGQVLVKRGFMKNLFFRGGSVMYVLALLSLLGVTIVVERLFALRRSKILPRSFIAKIRARWLKGDIKGAFDLCDEADTPMARVLRAGLAKHRLGLSEVERAIDGAGGHEIQSLSKHLRALGALSSIAPLLGILGTVMGMIRAFNVIATSGSRRPDLIANGISEALLTTAVGLSIGIPLFLLYHYLRGRTDQLTWEMEEVAIEIVENLAIGGEKIAL